MAGGRAGSAPFSSPRVFCFVVTDVSLRTGSSGAPLGELFVSLEQPSRFRVQGRVERGPSIPLEP